VFSDILDQKKNKRLREETMIKEEEKKKVLLSLKQKRKGEQDVALECLVNQFQANKFYSCS
jgi:hypothetical protein